MPRDVFSAAAYRPPVRRAYSPKVQEIVEPPLRPRHEYWVTRALLLRALGGIYAVAFAIVVSQGKGLLGSGGILPATDFLRRALGALGSAAWVQLPSLFWVGSSDAWLLGMAWTGLALSLLALAGYGSALVFAVLWVLQLSFESVGQIFWGYGWELLLAELGFLAIFTAPTVLPFRGTVFPPSLPLVVLHRWVLFRVLFGAGLIKLRGDECWTALTCLATHYETQPNPGPLSLYFHALPLGVHKAGGLFNHLVELVVPFALFGPARLRTVAGALATVFQLVLIASGNLSFLNWLTLVVTLACFDDSAFERVLPRALLARLHEAGAAVRARATEPLARRRTVIGLLTLIGVLSIAPTVNLLLPNPAMNASFDPLHLVNTYGAFGSVDRERHEVILEGTRGDPLAGDVRWEEYDFRCKPGDVNRRPCWITPYHYRLDWQMWFAGHRRTAGDAWFLRFVIGLLRGAPEVSGLLENDPFRDTPSHAPRYIRALLYHYRFVRPGEPGYWKRELIGEYLRPIALDDAEVMEFTRRLQGDSE